MELDFDATEEVNDYVTVPPGSYACRVAEVRQRTTRNGEPLWSLRLIVCEGEHTGRQAAWDNLVFSTRGRTRVRKVFAALGVPSQGKVNIEPKDLEGKEALVEVRAAEYRNNAGDLVKRNEVPFEGYRPLVRDESDGRIAIRTPTATKGRGGTADADANADEDDEEIPF